MSKDLPRRSLFAFFGAAALTRCAQLTDSNKGSNTNFNGGSNVVRLRQGGSISHYFPPVCVVPKINDGGVPTDCLEEPLQIDGVGILPDGYIATFRKASCPFGAAAVVGGNTKQMKGGDRTSIRPRLRGCLSFDLRGLDDKSAQIKLFQDRDRILESWKPHP